jgi:hypothetical protein
MRTTNQYDPQSVAKSTIASNLSWVEEGVLYSALRSRKFWAKYCRDLVNKPDEGTLFKDFTKDIHNVLYNIADAYHTTVESQTKDADKRVELTYQVALNMLAAEVGKGNITQDEFHLGSQILDECFVKLKDVKGFEPFMNVIVPIWLNRKRTRFLSSKAMDNQQTDSNDLTAQLRRVQLKTARGLRKEQPSFKDLLLKGRNPEEPIRPVFPLTSIPSLNRCLGGGVIEGLCGVIICPSNGGKTVLTNQFGSDWALNKFRVLVISTEHTVEEMFVRQVAANCMIDFDKLHRGYRAGNLTDKENERVNRFVERVGPYLRIEDMRDNPMNLATDIEMKIEELREEENFDTQILIVDWLGAKASEGLDSSQLSNYLTNSLGHIRDQCHNTGVAGVVMCQADANTVKNEQRVSYRHGRWCKSLHVYADWGFGVSLLEKAFDEEGSGTETMDTFARKQYFHFFKTRNSSGGTLPVERDFMYQRFVAPIEGSGGGSLITGLSADRS